MKMKNRRRARLELLERRDLLSVTFSDVSSELDFVHRSWEHSGDGLAGAAWIDYDNDDNLDLFLTNGRTQDNALYRNLGDGTFTDVTVTAGIGNGLGNAGVVAGDIDNDGFVDLFLTGDGGVMHDVESPGVKFYHNNRNGTFSDITVSSGVVGPDTAWGAAMADIDNDGFLDLFITAPGSLATKTQHTSKLFHNNGDLTFTDITNQSGVDAGQAACAASFSDYDIDGDVDLFVSNCNDVNFAKTPMQLFRNDGDLNFTDVSAESGLASYRGYWMSTTMGDYDGDGDIDVFASNLGGSGRRHGLFSNQGDGTFVDVAGSVGVSNWEFGWGATFSDFDNDGHTDLFFAGSLPMSPFNILGSGKGNPGRLFFNDPAAPGTLTEASANVGVNLSNLYTSGVAQGDFNRDGFADLVVMTDTWSASSPGQPVLLQNDGNQNNWLGVELVGTVSNRDAVGARVTLRTEDLTQVKEIYAGSSFLSMDSQSLRFGLGQSEQVTSIRVAWPSGAVEMFSASDGINRVLEFVEGTGEVPPTSTGDFDANGQLDTADVDALVAEIVAGTHDEVFDLTADSKVDRADLDQWLVAAGSRNFPSGTAYPSGDANLDGKVNAADLNSLALSWRGNSAAWSDGDFNADGVVDAADLNALALNWRTDVTAAGARTPRAPLANRFDFAIAPTQRHNSASGSDSMTSSTTSVSPTGSVSGEGIDSNLPSTSKAAVVDTVFARRSRAWRMPSHHRRVVRSEDGHSCRSPEHDVTPDGQECPSDVLI